MIDMLHKLNMLYWVLYLYRDVIPNFAIAILNFGKNASSANMVMVNTVILI